MEPPATPWGGYFKEKLMLKVNNVIWEALHVLVSWLLYFDTQPPEFNFLGVLLFPDGQCLVASR